MECKAGSAVRGYRRMHHVVGLVFLLGASVAIAQLPTTTVLGVVRDSSGAVVPGATLTANNVDTGQIRTVVSSGDGSYRFSALPVGSYQIRVELTGFQTAVRSGLTLRVAQEAVVNFVLEVGAVTERVEVMAEAPLVNTVSGSLGTSVDEAKIANLPLNGRNYIDLTLLQPGIQRNKTFNNNAGMTGIYFSSNGAPIRSNNFLLDGAPIVNPYGGSTSSATGNTLGLDGIREWRVITNSFSAEYGMTMGSQMVMVSKGGTNNFHGTLFEYFRSNAFDARNFFDYKTTASNRRSPAYTRNNFGASFGGPIKKDKTFFHAVYEGLRARLGPTAIGNTMSPSAKVDGGAGGVAKINPVIKPFLQFWPDPNLPDNKYTIPLTLPSNDNYGQLRVDQTISEKDSLFVRYTGDGAYEERLTSGRGPEWVSYGETRSQFATLSESHIFSPALLGTFRASFSRTRMSLNSKEGPNGPEYSLLPGKSLAPISVGGLTGLGPENNVPIHIKQNIFTESADMFYTKNQHTFKFGALLNQYGQYIGTENLGRGRLQFANLTQFLLGRPNYYEAPVPGARIPKTWRYRTFAFYLQDDVRVTSRFTLNLGLRYEFNTQMREVSGREAALGNMAVKQFCNCDDLSQVSGLEAALRDVTRDAKTTLGPSFKNSSLRNFSPRFGFAWDVMGDGMTAIRGGFGLLYDIGNIVSALFVPAGATPPFSGKSLLPNPPPLTGLPLSFPPGVFGKTLNISDYNMQQPHMLQYNLAVERKLPFNMALTLAYGGSRGLNLRELVEGNTTIPQILSNGTIYRAGNEPRVNPNWDVINFYTTGGNSWYNSLQVGLQQRLSKGLQLQGSYTWSKLLDTPQTQFPGDGAGNMQEPTRPGLSKGRSNFDKTHNFHLNTIYNFPQFTASNGFLGRVLNGWWLSSILSLESGFAMSPTISADRARIRGGPNTATNFANVLPGRDSSNFTQGTSAGCLGVPAGTPLGTPDKWFDPCAFAIPEPGFLGNAGRNIITGPGLATLDFSLAKNSPLKFLGEGGMLEFRGEFFNILNHANFNNPPSVVFAGTAAVQAPQATAGKVSTPTATDSRKIQFSLKVIF